MYRNSPASGLNQQIEHHLSTEYDIYHRECMRLAMTANATLPPRWKADVRLSIIMPLHAQWFVTAFDAVKDQQRMIKQGQNSTGIKQAVAKYI